MELRLIKSFSVIHSGEGRLEICCYGAWPPISVDIHTGGAGGHGRDHPAGTHALRRPCTNRRKAFRNCISDSETRATTTMKVFYNLDEHKWLRKPNKKKHFFLVYVLQASPQNEFSFNY